MTHVRFCAAMAALSLSSWGGVAYAGGVAIMSAPPAEPRAAQVELAHPGRLLLNKDAPVARIDFPPPEAAELAALRARNAVAADRGRRVYSKALAVGFGREIPSQSRTLRLSELAWVADGEGGRSARIEVRSPNAYSLRIAMQLPATGSGLAVRFAGSAVGAQVFGPVPGSAVAQDTQRFGQFWSPVLEGDVATIEFHAGPEAAVDTLTLTLPRIAHQLAGNAELRSLSAKTVSEIGQAQSCNIDVACVAPTVALYSARRAVAQLLFVNDDGGEYLCTGTLLNTVPTTNTPYLYTAGHCMKSAKAAHTLNTLWFFDAVNCNSNAVPPYVQLTGGAELLGRSQDHDWALVRLNESPPYGVRYAAWNAVPVPLTSVTTTLHHPVGDLKKWAGGYVGQSVFLSDAVVHGEFNEVPYTSGITEGGSSGSALLTYNESGGYYEVRGAISEGNLATCPAAPGAVYDDYSRMQDMLPLVRQYLAPGTPNPSGKVVAVEYYNRNLDHYFLTAAPGEVHDLDTGVHEGWERTGLRFLAYGDHASGTNPVCRFYRAPAYGDSHFYSASPTECAATASEHPVDWIYESPAVFYIRLPAITGDCPKGTQPLWRFFNKATINHRYTAEVVIRDQMRAKPSVWIPEGYGPEQTVMCAELQ